MSFLARNLDFPEMKRRKVEGVRVKGWLKFRHSMAKREPVHSSYFNRFDNAAVHGYRSDGEMEMFIRWIVKLVWVVMSFDVSAAHSGAAKPITPQNFTSIDDPNIVSWVSAQNQKTWSVLDEKLGNELQKVFSYLPMNSPLRLNIGKKEIYRNREGLILEDLVTKQRHQIVRYSDLDPSSTINDFKVSRDGRYMTYGVSHKGDDLASWYVYDMSELKLTNPSPLKIRLFSPHWNHDSTGFYYPKSPTERVEKGHRVDIYFHKLGTNYSDDRLSFSSPEQIQSTQWKLIESENGRNLLSIRSAEIYRTFAETKLWIFSKSTSVSPGTSNWQTVHPIGDTLGRFVGVHEDNVILRTSECGGGFCLKSLSMEAPYESRIIIPEQKHLVMRQPVMFGDVLAVPYHDKRDMSVVLKIFTLEGHLLNEFRPENFGLHNQGGLSTIYGHPLSQRIYFQYSNWVDQRQFSYSKKEGFRLIKQIKPGVLSGLKNISYRLHFAPSFDGKKVPLWIFRRTDIDPKFLFVSSYGGIGLNSHPIIRPDFLMALELGGAAALIGSRGGQELGADWYLEGLQDENMRSVKDTVWATRWIKRKDEFKKIPSAVSGGSFGGLHTYLTYLNFQADYDVFLAQVPLSDIRSFISSQNPNLTSPISYLLLDDFGVHRDKNGDVLDFAEFLTHTESWSPLANIKSALNIKPKPLLTIAGRNDGRGGPQQSYFMQSALEQRFRQSDSVPIYMIELDLGHSGWPFWYEIVFLGKQLGLSKRIPLLKQASTN